MSHSSLAANMVPIDRGASHEAACARKLQVLLLMGSGVVAAAQIGKAIISVPMIRSDLALGLDLAGLIVATFATLGAMTGIGAGLVVGRLGAARSLIGGMGVITLGNVIGASAPDQLVLLVARIIEGVGFLAVVVAIPSMLAQLVTREKRDFVMAAWSAYMPIGIMLMLLVAPLLPTIGWRSFWLANSLVTGSCAILLAIHAPTTPATACAGAARFFADALTIVRQPSCLVLAFAFFGYSCQIFSLAFALPLLLTSVHGVSLGAAGLLSAMVLAVSAIGHLSSSLLLRVGVPIWANVAAAFGFFALSSFAVYGNVLPPQGISLVAALALGIGGLAPGALYAAAPHAAPSPSVVPPTHRTVAASQQSRPVCRPGCAWPVGRASRLAGRAGHPRACRTVRPCLRIRASTYSRHRRTARAQRTTVSCYGAPMIEIIE
jgi:MFS transporter, DHA1 family, inner membrane transport protein